jgi:hypothetical protein
MFHNWVKEQDIVGTNQLSQGYKDNTIRFYGNSAAGKDNNHGKDNEPGERFGINKGLAENVWRHQT